MFIRLSFVTLIFALSALGKPLVKRDGTSTLKSIQEFDSCTNMLTHYLRELSPSDRSTAKNVEITVADMDNSLKHATANTSNSKGFTDEQAKAILGAVKEPLQHDIETALAVLVAKKTTITDLDLAPLARLSMESLKDDAIDFGEALIPKMPESFQSDTKEALGDIVSWLTNAMNEYSTQ